MPPKKKQTSKPWTKQHVDKFNWLYNWYVKNHDDKATKETFINENKRKLMTLIDKSEWSMGSKEGHYFMISRYLFNKNNNDKYVKLYAQAGYDLKQAKDQIEGKNELDDKEKENHRTIEYLTNCLELHKSKSTENIKEHYKHLLLMMLIKQPPLRTSFYTTAKFLRLQADNDKTSNYVYITRKGKLKVYYIVNKDKASNYKLYNMNKGLSKIKLEDPELIDYINYSFITYPRTYLFEINKKQISETTILNYLREITNTPLINFDMIRSAFITYFYEHNKTFDKREALSKMMRHSQQTASKNYLKVSNTEKVKPDEKIKELEKEIILLNKIIEEYNTKLKAYEKEPENEKLFNKKRNDILYLLNKGKASKPETMTKYKILFDDKNKKYY
jgi:hypothetical protein